MEEERLRVEAEEIAARRLRAKAEEEKRLQEVQRQADEAARAREEARLRAKAEEEEKAAQAAAERAALAERLAKYQQDQREAELREKALNEEMKRVRLEAQVEQERLDKVRAEARRQEQLSEEINRVSGLMTEALRRHEMEERVRQDAREDLEKVHERLAASQEERVSVATASARARLAPLAEAESQAREELQAMQDRKTFLAETPRSMRAEVQKAQGILDGFQAITDSTVRTNLPRMPNPPTVSESRVCPSELNSDVQVCRLPWLSGLCARVPDSIGIQS